MITLARSKSKGFDPDEIRRLVQLGKDRGLIADGGKVNPIDKNGDPATELSGVRSQWMLVDPATAKRWLENNFRNRKVSDEVVLAYARDMTNGVWVPTHQGIAFNDRDELIDGQHRLRAIVLSGKTLRMMVTFGLPSDIEGQEMTTMDAVDRGRTRSVADQLQIQHGLKNGSVIAAVTASLGTICYGHRTRRLSVGQTLDILRAFEHPVQFVITHRSKEHGLKTAGCLAAFAFAIASEDSSIAEVTTPIGAMYERLVDLDDHELEGTSIGHLRKFLTSPDAKLLTRAFDRGLSELVLQAIYLEQIGRKVEKLDMSSEGADYFRQQQKKRVEKIAKIFTLP